MRSYIENIAEHALLRELLFMMHLCVQEIRRKYPSTCVLLKDAVVAVSSGMDGNGAQCQGYVQDGDATLRQTWMGILLCCQCGNHGAICRQQSGASFAYPAASTLPGVSVHVQGTL